MLTKRHFWHQETVYLIGGSAFNGHLAFAALRLAHLILILRLLPIEFGHRPFVRHI